MLCGLFEASGLAALEEASEVIPFGEYVDRLRESDRKACAAVWSVLAMMKAAGGMGECALKLYGAAPLSVRRAMPPPLGMWGGG